MEKPFEYLKRKENNAFFEKDVVENWYKARAFVLDKLKDVAYEPTSDDHLHVVVDVDKDDNHLSPLMLSVVRQIALTAHYLNFFEGCEKEAPRNRTVITLVSKNPQLRKELDKEEYLCNLLSYCKCVFEDSKTENNDSYIDLEFHFVSTWSEKAKYRFAEKDVEDFCDMKKNRGEDIFSIDTRMASYADRMYQLGATIDNLPAEDIHCTERYSVAIDVFRYKMLKSRATLIFEKDKCQGKSTCEIKEKISNILCADCFKIREWSIEKCKGTKFKSKKELWAEYNEPLSRSEHSRWVVEKLILGYRPLNDEERAYDENLQMLGCGKNKDYRKMLKRRDNDPAHIDLCSYIELRRINPNDLKYDSFLMLAIPIILHKVRKRFLWFF